MAAISADNIFNCIFLNENDRIPIQISMKYVPSGSSINHKPALVQVMAWRRTGDKPLPGPIMTQFIDAYSDQEELSTLYICMSKRPCGVCYECFWEKLPSTGSTLMGTEWLSQKATIQNKNAYLSQLDTQSDTLSANESKAV